MQPIKTAIVGFGISGQCFQAPILEACPEFDLCAVVSSNKSKVLEQLLNVTVFSSVDAMLARDDIELVIIATPNEWHVPYAAQALRAGKHVVVEKPFCIQSHEGEELLEIAAQSGKCLSVYQSRRYDGDFKTIASLIENKTLDNVHTFYSSYNRYRPEVKVRWREQDIPGAGILYDLGAHLIDQALCLFGMPHSVTAQLKNQRPNAQAVDHFHVVMHYEHTDAIVHGNCLSTAEGPRFQVFANNAAFIKFGMDGQEDLLREKKGPGSSGWGLDDPTQYGTLTTAAQDEQIVETLPGGYEAFYQQMAKAIRYGEPVPVSGIDALNVIRVIEAAYLSSKQRKTIDIGA